MKPLHYDFPGTGAWYFAFGIQSVAFAWLVTMVLNEPPDMVGIAQMAFLAPAMLFMLLGGVPAERVQQVYKTLQDVDGLMIVGSSLMVFSAYRFCRKAAAMGKPMALVNLGKTLADDLATLKIEDDCSCVLTNLLEPLSANRPYWRK